MPHNSSQETTDQTLIRSDFNFFTPCLARPASAKKYQHDWEHVLSLARSDGLLPEQGPRYPLAPAVTVFNPSAEQILVEQFQGVLDAVECVANNYATDVEIQQFLDLPPFIQKCALADPNSGRHVNYCRFDFAGNHLGKIKIFEVGGDFPGVSITSGLLNKYWRQTSTIGALVNEYQTARSEEPGWFVAELLELGFRRGIDISNVDRISLFRSEELCCLPEVLQLADQIRRHRRIPICLAADQPDVNNTSLGFLMYMTQPFAEDPDRYAAVLKRIANGKLIVFNGILGRAVGSNKLTLAVMSDPRFRRLFTPRQVTHIDTLVPWSRKLDDGVTIHETVTQRTDLVLKEPYNALSMGVHVGRKQSPTQWRRLVDIGARQGWLVQEFIPSQRIATGLGHFYRTLGAVFMSGRVIGYVALLNASVPPNLSSSEGGLQAVFGNYAHKAGLDSTIATKIKINGPRIAQ